MPNSNNPDHQIPDEHHQPDPHGYYSGGDGMLSRLIQIDDTDQTGSESIARIIHGERDARLQTHHATTGEGRDRGERTTE